MHLLMKICKNVTTGNLSINGRICLTTCRKYSNAWLEPLGHSTGITLYNTASKCKVPLLTMKPNFLTWYSCGPTVYSDAHIGHALCYVKLDIIRRILEKFFHINVVQVMGITDIDDKIINRANDLNISIKELTIQTERNFYRDMKLLGVERPSVATRVSEHIPQILDFVKRILLKNLAYVAVDGSVYFDTAVHPNYGKLYKPDISDLTSEETKETGKRFPHDFAIWKAAKAGEPSWSSPWGPGRPGWHIECSAMACHIFGRNLDIHSGGVDLVFPHHENEEAQCCAHNDTAQWCNYWIHTEIDYTSTSLLKANALVKQISSFLEDCHAYTKGQLSCKDVDEPMLLQKLHISESQISSALANDFDTAKVVKIIMQLITAGNSEIRKESKGAASNESSPQDGNVNEIMNAVTSFRNQVRNFALVMGADQRSEVDKQKHKDLISERKPMLTACDKLRSQLQESGIFIKDHGLNSSWSLREQENEPEINVANKKTD